MTAPARQGEHTVGSPYDWYSPIDTYDYSSRQRPRKGIRVVRRGIQVVQKNHADHSTWIPNWGQNLGPRLYPATEINASDAEEAFRSTRYGPLVVINDSIKLDTIKCGRVLETMPMWIHGTLQCQQAHVERLLQVLHRVRLSSEGAIDMFSSTMVMERATAALLYQILFFSESTGDWEGEHPYIDRERFITWGACFLRGTLSQLDFSNTARDFVEQPERTLFTYVELNRSQSRDRRDISTDKSRYGFGLCMAVVQVTDEVVIVQHCKYVLLMRKAVHGDKHPIQRSYYADYYDPSSSAGNTYNVVGQCFASTLDESLNLGDLKQSPNQEDVDSRRYASDDSDVGRSNSDVETSDIVKRSAFRKSDLERFGSPWELKLY
jgi:hypothetical protein